jgi:hypothetical protein
MSLKNREFTHSEGGFCMFFLLPALAVVAETAAAVTGGVIASTGTIGATVAAGTATIGGLAGTATAGAATTIGIETAAATTLGTIAAGGTTTALNVGIAEVGKSLMTSD